MNSEQSSETSCMEGGCAAAPCSAKDLVKSIGRRLFSGILRLLARVPASAAPRKRRFCYTCGKQTGRIAPRQHWSQGKLHPQCPRCGGVTVPCLRWVGYKLALRAQRRLLTRGQSPDPFLSNVLSAWRAKDRQVELLRNLIVTTKDTHGPGYLKCILPQAQQKMRPLTRVQNLGPDALWVDRGVRERRRKGLSYFVKQNV